MTPLSVLLASLFPGAHAQEPLTTPVPPGGPAAGAASAPASPSVPAPPAETPAAPGGATTVPPAPEEMLPDAALHALATHDATWIGLPAVFGIVGLLLGTSLHVSAFRREVRNEPNGNFDLMTMWGKSVLALIVSVLPVVVLFAYWALSETTTAQLFRQQGFIPYFATFTAGLVPLIVWAVMALPGSGGQR